MNRLTAAEVAGQVQEELAKRSIHGSLTSAASILRRVSPIQRLVFRAVILQLSDVLADVLDFLGSVRSRAILVSDDYILRGKTNRGRPVPHHLLRLRYGRNEAVGKMREVVAKRGLGIQLEDGWRAVSRIVMVLGWYEDKLYFSALSARISRQEVKGMYNDLSSAVRLIEESANDFLGADLSSGGVEVYTAKLGGIRWDENTRWPTSEFNQRMHRASVEYPPGSGIYTVMSESSGATSRGVLY
ncbi:hypothetical protein HNR23_002229 [Nocardiopsis mwathae]|uniref:Uncharacterized protein n=1 Tax=Nocardiopsis mwathae TaxID=1472723 RepID=A0A7W9YHG4_9ACTN|nr:hypothetical protein [Nocardiopsis mwathae]MBB6172169.1 hypothetical protein [Nocardiopsis mwathae]